MQPELQFLYILIFVLVFFMIFVAYVLQLVYDKQSIPFSSRSTSLNNALVGTVKVARLSTATFSLTLPNAFCFSNDLRFALLTSTINDANVTIRCTSHTNIFGNVAVDVFTGIITNTTGYATTSIPFKESAPLVCRHNHANNVYTFILTNNYENEIEIQYETTILTPWVAYE